MLIIGEKSEKIVGITVNSLVPLIFLTPRIEYLDLWQVYVSNIRYRKWSSSVKRIISCRFT